MVVYKILWVFKTYIYALFTFISPFYSTATDVKEMPFLKAYSSPASSQQVNNQFNQVDGNHSSLSDILLFDYTDLVFFSKKMNNYGKTKEEFNQYFEEGLLKSFEFYKSSDISQSEINSLIEVNFCANSSLNHQIERPQATKINLRIALQALDQFSGEWHGNWQEMQVHHLWLPVRKFVQTITDDVTLMGFQSCFTGDGFGWNYIVKHSNRIVILGFVVHFDDEGAVISKNPHYAFLNNRNQLVWVSEGHIYYEFICNQSNSFHKKHYVISGAGYKNQNRHLKLVDGFQAIYSSSDVDLPAFKSINLNRWNF